MKMRVLIVDDHSSLRHMLAMILTREGEYLVTGQAGNGQEALRLCKALSPDIVILDLLLPELCGIEVLRRLRAEMAHVRVLVYSGTMSQVQILRALELRPHGFVEKGDTLDNLREALRAVAGGRGYFSRFANSLLTDLRRGGDLPLTSREREVLQLVAESCSSKEIAGRLGLATKTVENHRAHLMEKLQLHDVAALTRYAVSSGLVSAE